MSFIICKTSVVLPVLLIPVSTVSQSCEEPLVKEKPWSGSINWACDTQTKIDGMTPGLGEERFTPSKRKLQDESSSNQNSDEVKGQQDFELKMQELMKRIGGQL